MENNQKKDFIELLTTLAGGVKSNDILFVEEICQTNYEYTKTESKLAKFKTDRHEFYIRICTRADHNKD